MKKIIARNQELKFFKKVHTSKRAEFLAVYGRRRVGKTYLIREFFSEHSLFCEVTGQKGEPMSVQLEEFASALKSVLRLTEIEKFQNWHAAFEKLLELLNLQKVSAKKPFVLFLDELPWLVTDRSDCLSALDHFWNKFLSRLPHFKLIICGSAASWMLDHVINAKGGLHNRVTQTLLLKPFDLTQTAEYLAYLGIRWTHKQVVALYMVMGGIPYYLDQLHPKESLVQNINRLCFTEGGFLQMEFRKLFASLFDMAEENLRFVRAIAMHKNGIERSVLLEKLKLPSGGNSTRRLGELEAAGFIRSYRPFGKSKRNTFFRVVDEYVLFYLHWIEEPLSSGHPFAAGYWETKQKSPVFLSWSGLAFENIGVKHVEKIRHVLGLDRIACQYSSWFYSPAKSNKDETGAQIDLLIDRDDGVITLCEMKYADGPFVLDKTVAKNLLNKIERFTQVTQTHKQVEMVMVTTFGVKPGVWVDEVLSQEIKMDCFFE